jgi:hypothetical protein
VSGLLPAGMRCSAFWYAQHRGLPTSLGYLKALGLTAYRMAVWEGLEPWQVPEGPWIVHMWPERIWDAAAQNPVARDAEFWSCPPPPEGTMAYDDWTRMADQGWDGPYD